MTVSVPYAQPSYLNILSPILKLWFMDYGTKIYTNLKYFKSKL